jgi:acyl dehydratase
MKFKCIKDYFMHVRCEGDTPELGFKAGDVYTFYRTATPEHVVTHADHSGDIHYMDLDEEFFEYFIQVEENNDE